MYLLLLLLLLPLTSCYEIVDRGEETSISWSTNVHVLAVAIPALLAITAAWLWRRPAQRAVGLVLFVLALGGAFAAFVVFTSKITITKDEIYDWHGFPWDRVKRGFAFGDVARLSFHIEHKRSGRQTSAAQIWDLQLRNGAFEHLDPGDLWDRAQEDILERLRQRGVRIGVDPAILGRPSDDPFVVTVATGELHLDPDSAKERLSALVFGGFSVAAAVDGDDRPAVDRIHRDRHRWGTSAAR